MPSAQWIAGHYFFPGNVASVRRRWSLWSWLRSLRHGTAYVYDVILQNGYHFTTDQAGWLEIEEALNLHNETMRVLGMVHNMQEFSKYR